jgi:methylglutaconyl-CoA hydratase
VEKKVSAVLKCGPNAVKLIKELVADSPLAPMDAAKRLADSRQTDEAREGIGAFLEKRKASFVV